jgi:hypothetical protein
MGLPAYLKPFFLPQPMHPLDVHMPAFLNQQRTDPPIPEPWPAKSQPIHVGDQRPVLQADPPAVALRAAGLPDRPADPTLGIPQPLVKMLNALTPAGWGQEFFEL